ncbi:MAG: hypothetical protein C5B49_08955 [Bdellovibrio sp.]|nr:MAG: hypothetical protein C5B49_08955 [Bdellovibrio sp.]
MNAWARQDASDRCRIGAHSRECQRRQPRDSWRHGVLAIDAKGVAAKAGIQKGDVLIGLHKWETVSVDNVRYVLDHPDLGSFNPMPYIVVRSGNIRRGTLRVPVAEARGSFTSTSIVVADTLTPFQSSKEIGALWAYRTPRADPSFGIRQQSKAKFSLGPLKLFCRFDLRKNYYL